MHVPFPSLRKMFLAAGHYDLATQHKTGYTFHRIYILTYPLPIARPPSFFGSRNKARCRFTVFAPRFAALQHSACNNIPHSLYGAQQEMKFHSSGRHGWTLLPMFFYCF